MSKLTKEQEKVDKIAEKIIGVIYTPPPMSPKFLEQEKKKIIPILAKEIKMAEEREWKKQWKIDLELFTKALSK